MRIEFILTTVAEVGHFGPVIVALSALGVDAVTAIPDPLFSGTPYGWSDLESIKQAVSNCHPRIRCENINLDSDAVVTTHPADVLTAYHHAKTFRMQYGVGLVDPTTDHPMGAAADFYLVHGPFGRRVQFTAHGLPSPLIPEERVKVIGYPRLDAYWFQTTGLQIRPDILWLPTWSVRSSIDEYFDAIKTLGLPTWVKPHHCTDRWEPERMTKLRAGLFVPPPDVPSEIVYAASDLVLADLSSGAFVEALHVGKPVVGLMNQSDFEIKHLLRLPSGVPVCGDPAMLAETVELARAVDWQNDPLIAELRTDLITSTHGHDGAVAARVILECMK